MGGAIFTAGVMIMWGLICISNSLDKIAKALRNAATQGASQ